LGLPKKTVPPLAVPLPVTLGPKKYEKDVLLVTEMENTPFKLTLVGLPPGFASGGTPEIRTVVGIPGTKPVRGAELAVVAVTVPAVSVSVPRVMEVEGCMTLTPLTAPEPPGVT
jgi:hypothetical protein